MRILCWLGFHSYWTDMKPWVLGHKNYLEWECRRCGNSYKQLALGKWLWSHKDREE